MKIGIGITTLDIESRVDLAEKCLDSIRKHTNEKSNKEIIVCTTFDYGDVKKRRGVAASKNLCLKALKDCDYIFLFDDDCYPILDDWDEYIIKIAEKTNNHHFCYNKEPFCKVRQSMFINGEAINCFDASGGVMLFYTKEAIQKVGAFYEGYGLYGYEHIGHSIRIFKSGLTCDLFPCPENLSSYIYSIDYEDHSWFQNHSTMTIDEKTRWTERNKEVWKKEDQKIHIPIT